VKVLYACVNTNNTN